MLQNALLIKAVQYLYGKGVISKDKDIADRMKYNKATVSSYINGKTKASVEFERNFEKAFNLKLADFAAGGKEETIEQPDALQLLSENVLQMKAEIQACRQLVIETLAAVSDRPVSDVQLMAEKLLQHNLSRIVNELKQG
jgi:transcriptional regulator with XRE-family HTH domain